VNEFEQHYIGINYLIDGHDLKFMLGYEMNELMEPGQADEEVGGFRARMQFLF
jgi:hypothetical protein